MKKLVIASDHAGFELKQNILSTVQDVEWKDLGTFDTASVDFPDYADLLAQKIISGEYQQGVLVCGSGQGMAMRANKFKEIRAALCWNVEITKLSRAHNNANVLCLPGRFITTQLAADCIKAFLNTEFEGGRHSQRVAKISKS